MLRRQSREVCLQILFQKEFNSDFNLPESLSYFGTVHKKEAEVIDYARFLLTGTLENLESIDSLIQKYSKNWETSRMSAIDLNILRPSIFEGIFADPQVSPKVIINESVEIAKKYSSKDSSAFINGILDQCFRNESLLSNEENNN